MTVTPSGPVNGAVVAWQLEGDNWGEGPHIVRSTTYPDVTLCDISGIEPAADLILDAGGQGEEVPTLSQYALIGFIAIFAIAGVLFIRRKN